MCTPRGRGGLFRYFLAGSHLECLIGSKDSPYVYGCIQMYVYIYRGTLGPGASYPNGAIYRDRGVRFLFGGLFVEKTARSSPSCDGSQLAESNTAIESCKCEDGIMTTSLVMYVWRAVCTPRGTSNLIASNVVDFLDTFWPEAIWIA